MRYRSKSEIIGQILAVANDSGVTKTRTMYKAFLNYNQAKEFLTTLTERGMLRYDEKTQTFKTTEKGIMVLHTYTELSEFMKGIAQGKVTGYIESQIY